MPQTALVKAVVETRAKQPASVAPDILIERAERGPHRGNILPQQFLTLRAEHLNVVAREHSLSARFDDAHFKLGEDAFAVEVYVALASAARLIFSPVHGVVSDIFSSDLG